jgi:hypothetical protein
MKALIAHQVDAIFLSGDSAAPANIRQLLHTKGISLFEFPQADGYVRRFRFLSKLEIPAGRSISAGIFRPNRSACWRRRWNWWRAGTCIQCYLNC